MDVAYIERHRACKAAWYDLAQAAKLKGRRAFATLAEPAAVATALAAQKNYEELNKLLKEP